MEIFVAILTRTPIWVWPLLVALIWLGLSRRRTHDISRGRLLITPVIFGGLVVVKLSLAGFASTVVTGTVIGVAAGALFVVLLRPARNATRLPDNKFRIKGEWHSLSVMMLVFLTNYVAGVATSIAPEMAANPNLLFGVTLVNGFSAALMGGTVVAYLTASTEVPTLALAQEG